MKNNKKNQTKEWTPPTKIWNWMFVSIFVASMALNLGQQMSNSLLSLYANYSGAPANQIGQLMSMFAVTALIFRFVSGPAMNAFSRKWILAMAMGFMATAYFGFGAASWISSATGISIITILKCFRLIQGIGSAFGNSCCLTMVADVLPKAQFTTGIGYFACAQIIAQAIGPTVGVFLRDIFGYTVVYCIFGCLMLSSISVAAMVKLAPREKQPFNLRFDNMIAKEALIPAAVTFMVSMGFTSINSFLLVYSEEKGIQGASLFFTVYALTMIVTRPAVGKLTDRFGFVKVSVPSILMTALSLAIIGFADNLWMLLLAAFINAFGYGAVQPMLQSLCMKAVPSERRGSASSTNYIGTDASTLIGPSVCGIVAGIFGYSAPMWLCMIIPIVAGVIFILIKREKISKIEENFTKRV